MTNMFRRESALEADVRQLLSLDLRVLKEKVEPQTTLAIAMGMK